MNETRIHGVRVRFRNSINPIAVANLTRTLHIVPPVHRSLLTQIDVLPPGNFGHGPTYAGGGSGVGWPRLSELCFDNRYRPRNFPLNLTLLHEIGHIMENHYQCRTHLAPAHRAVIDSVTIPATAHTRSAEEHYAIAYQKVLCGSATREVEEAVYSSRAFAGVDTGSR